MSVIIRVSNSANGEVFVFGSPSWVSGVNGCVHQLRTQTHPNLELQADFDSGHRFDYYRLDGVGSTEDLGSAVSAAVSRYSLVGSRYHPKVARKRMSALEELKVAVAPPAVLLQVSKDGDVVYKWPSYEIAASVHGVKPEKIKDAVKDGVVKYGFLWRAAE